MLRSGVIASRCRPKLRQGANAPRRAHKRGMIIHISISSEENAFTGARQMPCRIDNKDKSNRKGAREQAPCFSIVGKLRRFGFKSLGSPYVLAKKRISDLPQRFCFP